MAAITAPAPIPTLEQRSALGWALADAITITWRNLKAMSRTPAVIMFSTIQPIIFVLTFRYVFGGSINIPGIPYVDFLMPGVFVQTVAFGAMNTGIGLSEDLHKGLIERFRSLPMARSAVLAGRSLADLVRNFFVVLMMIFVGFLVGFRVHAGVVPFVASIGLLLLFSFSFSWIFALIGLRVPNAEAAQAASFPVLALLVFASTAFVPIDGMPGWLQAYNRVQPVSVVVKAQRALSIGGDTAIPVFHALLWIVGLTVIFAPLAIRRYRQAA
ncbi:MAG: oleandomycin transport system permease protein [Acidimicrobiaceae bacterium]|jgi:ABC-2 type transport system permease protein/oleandomycin transport system permease protein